MRVVVIRDIANAARLANILTHHAETADKIYINSFECARVYTRTTPGLQPLSRRLHHPCARRGVARRTDGLIFVRKGPERAFKHIIIIIITAAAAAERRDT